MSDNTVCLVRKADGSTVPLGFFKGTPEQAVVWCHENGYRSPSGFIPEVRTVQDVSNIDVSNHLISQGEDGSFRIDSSPADSKHRAEALADCRKILRNSRLPLHVRGLVQAGMIAIESGEVSKAETDRIVELARSLS